jgi:hypothetical protein
MRRRITGSFRSQIQQIREAAGARPYEPPPYDDPVAIRHDMAQRVWRFVQRKREDEGATGPYLYDSIAAVYKLAEEQEAEIEARAAAERDGGES